MFTETMSEIIIARCNGMTKSECFFTIKNCGAVWVFIIRVVGESLCGRKEGLGGARHGSEHRHNEVLTDLLSKFRSVLPTDC